MLAATDDFVITRHRPGRSRLHARMGHRPGTGGRRGGARPADDDHPHRGRVQSRGADRRAGIAAGTTENVIPETAEMVGTLRTVDESVRGGVIGRIVTGRGGNRAPHTVAAGTVEIARGLPGHGQRSTA